MPISLIALLIAMAGLVGSHLVLAHPLRAALRRALGDTGFAIAYTLIAVIMVLAVLIAYHDAPTGPRLWTAEHPVVQAGFCIASYVATVLLIASLSNNPGWIGTNLNGLSTRMPGGAMLVTRHPAMFGIVLWSLAVLLLLPAWRNLITSGGFVVLALVGAQGQDRKKRALAPREWGVWMTRTRFWPDLRQCGALGLAWVGAVVPWLVMVWVLTRIITVPLGPWYLFPELPY